MEQILKKMMMNKTPKISDSWVIDDASISSSDNDNDNDWQLINPSDDEETPDFSFSDSEPETENETKPISESPPKKIPKKTLILERYNYNHSYGFQYGDVEGEEVEEGDEYKSSDDELDDELVPRSVSDRLGRNRMRKLGKREYSKMGKSKKLPVVYNRPGCVHGKHGLGLKHSLI